MTDHLRWRYATKIFDPGRKLSETDFSDLLETLRLSPSSFGLQPWKFIVVNDPALRARLRPHGWNQPQITDASALIVLCSLKTMEESYIRKYISHLAEVRGVDREALAGYEKMILDFRGRMTPAALKSWINRQVYLALGMLLNECAHRRIDACPIEGFDPAVFDKILNLDEAGLESIVVCAVGYRSSDDKYAQAAKVRFEAKDVIEER